MARVDYSSDNSNAGRTSFQLDVSTIEMERVALPPDTTDRLVSIDSGSTPVQDKGGKIDLEDMEIQTSQSLVTGLMKGKVFSTTEEKLPAQKGAGGKPEILRVKEMKVGAKVNMFSMILEPLQIPPDPPPCKSNLRSYQVTWSRPLIIDMVLTYGQSVGIY